MGVLGGISKIWSQDMAIDLGTANTLVVLKGKITIVGSGREVFARPAKNDPNLRKPVENRPKMTKLCLNFLIISESYHSYFGFSMSLDHF